MPATIQLVLLCGNTHYVILVHIQTLMCFEDWISASMPTRVNVGRPRTVRTLANEDVVERHPWWGLRDIAGQLRCTGWRRSIASISLLAERSSLSRRYINTPRMSSFCITFYGQKQHVLRTRVYSNVHNSHFWPRDNPHAFHDRGYQVSVSVLARIVGDTVVGHPPPDRLKIQCCTGAARPCASRLFSAWRNFGRCPVVAVRDISRKTDLMSRADHGDTWRSRFMHSLPWLQKISWQDVRQWLNATYPERWVWCRRLTVESPEGASLCIPSQDYRWSRGNTSRSCDNAQGQHDKACSQEDRAPHSRLPWNGRKPPTVRGAHGLIIWQPAAPDLCCTVFSNCCVTRKHTIKSLCANFV
jgi:hypothetical protein